MAVNEPDRHELYQTLERVLGKEPADTMMSLLPPVGWADVATKHDLEALEARMELRFEALDARMVAMEARMVGRIEALEGRTRERITRTALAVNIPAVIAAAGLALAAARLG